MIVGKNITNKSLGVYDNGVLINKFNIQDEKELVKIERNVVARKLAWLYFEPIEGNLDVKHLLDIHKFLFESIYTFAGKIRELDISKPGTLFCRVEYVEQFLNETLKKMKKDIINCHNEEDFVKTISNYYSELNIIHPFREGNGRAIREFIREYINKISNHLSFGNYRIDYSKMDKDLILNATILASRGHNEELDKQFKKAIINLNLQKDNKFK